MACNSNFSQIGKQLQKVLIAFTQNQTLCKLVYNTSSTPLSEPDVVDVASLIDTRFYTQTYKQPTEIKGVFIYAYFQEIQRATKNGYSFHSNLVVTVVCHRELWQIEGGLRVYDIMHEINTILNRKDVMNATSETLFSMAKYAPTNDWSNSMTLVYSSWDF